MTTDNEKGPLNQMESGQEKRSASEARALSEIVNGTPSENLCRRGSPATEQASETTAQQPRTYTTQPAESVMGIALRKCGNEMEWRHILACNPEFARMLPHEYFPVGTVLNLPPHPAAASRFEQPEKSLAPEGGSEARGRWIQANCPTGDIIKSPYPSNNREFPTSISESDCEHRIALAPSQPAAAPIDSGTVSVACFSGSYPRGTITYSQLAPSPADERAATFEEFRDRCEHYHGFKDETDDTQCTCPGNNHPGSWCEESDCPRRSRASSANETGAEGADALAHEVWSAAQRAPGEGIEDAVQRVAAILSRSPAMAAEAEKPFGWAQPKGGNYFTRNESSAKRIGGLVPVYTAPQPAQADARVGLTERQRMDLLLVADDMSVSGDAKLADALRALLAIPLPEPLAEVTDDKTTHLIKTLSGIIHDQTVAMQSAIIEWKHGTGAEAGLSWIVNTLAGPGHLPDFDAPHGKHAQFWFNANQANPLPACFCGNPSSSLWMGQGFCCDDHYREAKAKYDATRSGDAS
ncbi:hypothetical protein [Burkholderia vietnamiensis]|uniref:hypothetical protein n=1 Tax=Burkholderia vietnamiensis TaxID=60552 RepID=UPI001B906166|nr:hypothetical protein [Burkholderia vietnamiensis]MBR8150020.1 hypothetical protein [Burkholderia vietnamiensis]